MKKEPEIIRTSLRLPKPLYDKLAEAAERRGLTMHAEIIARLDATMQTGELSSSDFLNVLSVQSYNGERIVALLEEATDRMRHLIAASLIAEDMVSVEDGKVKLAQHKNDKSPNS